MLFYLDKSLITDSHDKCYENICLAINNLASQAMDSKHMLLGDIDAIIYFRKIFENQINVGRLFNSLYQNLAFMTIPSELTFYIEVVKDNPHQRMEGDVTICQKSYTDYLSLDSTIETRLICEDLNDAYFYGHILDWYKTTIFSRLNSTFHNQGGGGRNLHRTVEQELSSNHICICIVDTDIKYPGGTIKENSTCFLCSKVGLQVPEYKFLPLKVSELENLIPLNYIDIAFPEYTNGDINDKKNKEAFDYLRKEGEKILPFFDFKNGIKKNQEFANNADYINFAKLCYEQNVLFMNRENDFNSYLMSIPNKSNVYPALIGGSGTINMTIQLINSDHCPLPILLNFQREEWNRIGQNLLNWCVARNNEAIH